MAKGSSSKRARTNTPKKPSSKSRKSDAVSSSSMEPDFEALAAGLNLARMLGDKFLKQQDARFSSEPYISQAVHIDQANSAFTLLASDGFWDVIGVKKAFQFILEGNDKYSTDGDNSTEKIAIFLLSEARTLRTKDNTSILLLDFDRKSRLSSCKVDS